MPPSIWEVLGSVKEVMYLCWGFSLDFFYATQIDLADNKAYREIACSPIIYVIKNVKAVIFKVDW